MYINILQAAKQQYLQSYLVLVAIPMCARLCHLATEFAGARPVVVDHVVEGHVVAGQLLLLRDDQRPVYVWQKIGLLVKLVWKGGSLNDCKNNLCFVPESSRESWISTLRGPAARRGISCNKPGSSFTWW